MPCLINITLSAWKIFPFQRSSCERRTQKQSLKQWCTESYEKKVEDYPNLFFKKIILKIEKDNNIRGETKADVLEGGLGFPGLVEFSVYDTKKVNFSIEDEKLVCNINESRPMKIQLRKRSSYSSIALSYKIFITIT